jgi:hypothetical protein
VCRSKGRELRNAEVGLAARPRHKLGTADGADALTQGPTAAEYASRAAAFSGLCQPAGGGARAVMMSRRRARRSACSTSTVSSSCSRPVRRLAL